ncbi:UNVERIFIED_CONTAM: Mucin-2 [Gekko kuhli]
MGLSRFYKHSGANYKHSSAIYKHSGSDYKPSSAVYKHSSAIDNHKKHHNFSTCSDSYCTGWGDPHYKTFDGLYYSYQGNCTYTLVEEINKNIDNFGVYIDNYHCDPREPVSCPRTLFVRHETQEVRITTVREVPMKVQVLVNGQTVALPYKKYGLKVYESGVNQVVEIPELKMNVTYNGMAFTIRLPYHLFGNNTQGQCEESTHELIFVFP